MPNKSSAKIIREELGEALSGPVTEEGARERPGLFPNWQRPPGCPPFQWSRLANPVNGWQAYLVWGGNISQYTFLAQRSDWSLVDASNVPGVGVWLYLYNIDLGIFCPIWFQYLQGNSLVRLFNYSAIS